MKYRILFSLENVCWNNYPTYSTLIEKRSLSHVMMSSWFTHILFHIFLHTPIHLHRHYMSMLNM